MHRRHLRTRRPHAASAAVAAVVVSALALTSCAAAEPGAEERVDEERSVMITVDGDSTEQQVLGEIYSRTLTGQDRSNTLNIEASDGAYDRQEWLATGEADFVVGCTGDLLEMFNPATTEELARELGAAGDGGGGNPMARDVNQVVYDEFVGSLPARLDTTDPSPATGCSQDVADGGEGEEAGDAEAALPQNIVPVFRTTLFDRGELGALNAVTKRLTTQDLAEMTEEARKTGSVSRAVDAWEDGGNVRTEDDLIDDDENEDDGFLYTP